MLGYQEKGLWTRDAGIRVVSVVAGDDGQPVEERGGGDLLVEGLWG
jgi:hypothetical protein